MFCGSNDGAHPIYLETARAVGSILAREGITLVYGGAKRGLMGAVAEATLAGGGHVIGVIPQALVDYEIAHKGLTKLHVVDSMHARKALMVELSEGFMALPGGYGTLEELFEVMTWGQLGMHGKPAAILNTNGFYDALLGHIDTMIAEKFVHPDHRELLLSAVDPEHLLSDMRNYQPKHLKKWLASTST